MPSTVNGDVRRDGQGDENSNLYPDGIHEIVEENKALKQSLLEVVLQICNLVAFVYYFTL